MRFKILVSLSIASRAFAQEAPAVVAPPPLPPPRPEHMPQDEPMKTWSPHIADRGFYCALEIGAGGFADDKNIYKSGLGRGFVLGYGAFEARFEQYDLTDRSGMFTNVAHADGIASITSIAGRIPLAQTEMLQASALVGLAVLSRPSMIAPDEGDPTIGAAFAGDQVAQAQWGIGAQLGIGITIGGIFYADARLYPTYWSAISGTRYEYDAMTNTAAQVAVTQDQSPGGIPITLNAGIGYAF